MLKALGVICVVLGLICILATSYDVVTGKAALFSLNVIGAFVFHPVLMILGLFLLSYRPRRGLAPMKG
jgi:sugar phosphate permease